MMLGLTSSCAGDWNSDLSLGGDFSGGERMNLTQQGCAVVAVATSITHSHARLFQDHETGPVFEYLPLQDALPNGTVAILATIAFHASTLREDVRDQMIFNSVYSPHVSRKTPMISPTVAYALTAFKIFGIKRSRSQG